MRPQEILRRSCCNGDVWGMEGQGEEEGGLPRTWEWMDGKKCVHTEEAESDARRTDVKEIKERQARISRKIKATAEDVKDVIKNRDAEMKKGGKLKLLEEQAANLGKNVVKLNTQANIARKSIQGEKSKIVVLDNEVQEVWRSRA
jgi:structural maintenance of chromosome 2